MEYRRLAWTDNGYLALVPAETEVGDAVTICKDGRTPLILRERGKFEGDSDVHKSKESRIRKGGQSPLIQYEHELRGLWKSVSDSYVHGIMQGEAFKGGLCEDVDLV